MMIPKRIESLLRSLALAIVMVSGIALEPAQAQATSNAPTLGEIYKLRAEQQRPRSVVPFDPTQFDKYVGHYQLGPGAFFTISRDGDHFYAQLTGQKAPEIFPESSTKFFLTVVPAQIEFVSDSDGNTKELILHQNGFEQHAPKLDEQSYTAAQAALAGRILGNMPSPGTEAAVRRYVTSVQKGQPNYDEMTPTLAAIRRIADSGSGGQRMQDLGALKSLTFRSVTPGGMDSYDATFELGRAEFYVAPLTPDGKVGGLGMRIVESTDPAVQARIKTNKPTPGTEAALRNQIESLEAGQPNYDAMTPGLAAATRELQDQMLTWIKTWGALKSMAFQAIGRPMGNEVWNLTFEHAQVQAIISPLTPDGKIAILEYHP